ncbi:Ribonucleotide monophosphatase NagD [Limihaloglobus sulfuriphilus]|uniref:Ribonucleotide monophosphatase NagD n=1 Tax=Limihaloglobus sulfuriphilus TaxID=1851148 RepID=A0A1Q2MDC3_9BACT|nr:HAD-IIA family hydrolase [Limihaloglobus sulfuriphilus]AQQ70317.1 Ribonucleotide monophosphatase NagD [Limihaloglobus sulfuriphilus]
MKKITNEKLFDWFRDNRGEFDAVVFDIDGVLLLNHRVTPGSKEFLNYLRGNDIPYSLLTNDGCNSPEEKISHLLADGLRFETEEIISCGHGLEALALEPGAKDKPYYVMGSLGEPCYAETAGLKVIRDVEKIHECGGVIIGERRFDWQLTINAAVNFFRVNPSAGLIVPNPDFYFPVGHGNIELAPGAIALMIRDILATQKINIQPRYLGKPYQVIYEINHRHLETRSRRSIPKNRVLMVGDSMLSDIPGAVDFGYRSALMLSGITKLENLDLFERQPDYIFNAIG